MGFTTVRHSLHISRRLGESAWVMLLGVGFPALTHGYGDHTHLSFHMAGPYVLCQDHSLENDTTRNGHHPAKLNGYEMVKNVPITENFAGGEQMYHFK